MRNATRFAMAVAGAAVLLHAGRAWAPFHIVVIDQVFLGTTDCPNAQYVMMRLAAAGMGFVINQTVRAQNGDGSAAGDFGKFSMNLADDTALGATFIMGTSDAAGLFGLTMDGAASGHLVVPDGRVCFGLFANQPVDCVAYGNFTGDNTPRGAPAGAPPLGMALVRQTSTGNNANDFTAGAPAPRNNAGVTGTLGQCPSVNEATPTATEAAATPTATGGPPPACAGDCDGNGSVVINELVLGVGIALGSQPLSACAAFDVNGDLAVQVNELISGVAAALGGCAAAGAT